MKGRRCGMQAAKSEAKVARRVAIVGRKAVMVRSEEPVAKALVRLAFLRRDGGRATRRKTVIQMARTRKENAETTAAFLERGRRRWRTMIMGSPMMAASIRMSKAPIVSQKAICTERP